MGAYRRKKSASSPPVEMDRAGWRATLDEAVNAPGSRSAIYTRFHHYSYLNQMRLRMQGVNEPVASYKRWQELGRQVREGTKAKIVLAPRKRTVTAKNADGTPKLDENNQPRRYQIITGWKYIRSAHPYSNTDGPEPVAPAIPGWDVDTALAGLDIMRERFHLIDGNTQGYSYADGDGGRFLAINPVAAEPTFTMFHEVAHLVLGHCAHDDDAPKHRGIREFEAEAVAYLAAKELELVDWNPAESRDYIQTWLTGTAGEPTENNYQRIFGAVNKILTAGRVANATLAEAA